MMQHRNFTGEPISATPRESFYDRMQRIAAHNLRAAARRITDRFPEKARWFCIQVQNGRELAVEKELIDANVDAFMPREKWVAVRRGRKIEGERAYLPGYILVRFVPSPEAFQGLRRKRFVVDIVGGREGSYHVIRADDVAVFKSFLDRPDVSRMPTDKSFGDGDLAEITFGPFQGFNCLVTKVEWCREAWAAVVIEVSGRTFPIARMPLAFLKKL
jgi:transcriptional antiterminator NusG